MHISAEIITGSFIDREWRDANSPSGVVSGVTFTKQANVYVADAVDSGAVAALTHNSNVRLITTSVPIGGHGHARGHGHAKALAPTHTAEPAHAQAQAPDETHGTSVPAANSLEALEEMARLAQMEDHPGDHPDGHPGEHAHDQAHDAEADDGDHEATPNGGLADNHQPAKKKRGRPVGWKKPF